MSLGEVIISATWFLVSGGPPLSWLRLLAAPSRGWCSLSLRYGDYPKLPDHSQQERDPWYDWDHSDLRLNWGEPLHWNLDMYIRNRVDTSPTPVSWDVMCKHLFGFVAFMIFMFWLGDTYPTYQPVGPKQYPYNNLYLERGGDPSKEPEPVVHYDI